MRFKLPLLAVLLGVAGLVPLLVCALFSVSVAAPVGTAWLGALIFYGAVILSFLGGVHWGVALAVRRSDPAQTPDGAEHDRVRFGLGVLPSLIGWAALLSTLLLSHVVALAILIAGFIATMVGETRLRDGELLPGGYLWLRWALTVVVVVVLVTVLVLRLIGVQIAPS